MSDGWTTKKKKGESRNKREWLIDSGLVFLHSLFLAGCFFIFIMPRIRTSLSIGLGNWVSVFLVILVSLYISFVLHSLERTIAIFFLSSLLGYVLTSVTSVAFLFHSYTSYSFEIKPDITIKFSPAHLILQFVIGVFLISILGGIAGDYIAERTRKGEKRLTLRCLDCGTWNEQDAIHCSYCGKKLSEGHKVAEKRK